MDNANYQLHSLAFNPGLITPPETPKYHDNNADASPVEQKQYDSSADKTTQQGNLQQVSELIYNIIEHAVEEKIAEAIGPLRLNLRRMDRENCDFHEQNDTLSRQIDLHYKSIEKHSEIFDRLSVAQAESLKTANQLVGHLAQTTATLPSSIQQVVANAVQEQACLAMDQILAACQSNLPAKHNWQGCFSEYPVQATNGSHTSSSSSSASIGRSYVHDDQFLLQNCNTSNKSGRPGSLKSKLARLFRCSRWRN